MGGEDVNDADDYLANLLEKGANIPVTEREMQLPSWYNEQLFKRGQKYYRDNLFSMFVGMLCGLVAVLSIPSILQVLICTKKSGSPVTAYRRYIKTIFHVVAWNDYELKPDSRAWKSLEAVRKIHASSSSLAEKQNVGRITQKDMALTQFGFMGFTTLRAHMLGIDDTDEYLEATIHVWRVIGFILGIDNEFNLCAENFAKTKPRAEAILNKVYKPALENTEKDFEKMYEHLINGLWSFSPFLSAKVHLYFTKRLGGCTGYKYLKSDYKKCESASNSNQDAVGGEPEKYKELGLWDRWDLFEMVYMHQFLLRYTIVRWYFNFQILLSLFLIYYFPFLAFRFGFKRAYVRIFHDKAKSS